MTATERVVIIINAIFDRQIDPADMLKYMMAFASNVSYSSADAEEVIAEKIATWWIDQQRNELVVTLQQFVAQQVASEVARLTVEVQERAQQDLAQIIG
jgi:hypothetical protein